MSSVHGLQTALRRCGETWPDACLSSTPLKTHVTLAIIGSPPVVTDARSNAIQTQIFDMLGRPLRTVSLDAWDSDVLPDVAGQPLMAWRSAGLIWKEKVDEVLSGLAERTTMLMRLFLHPALRYLQRAVQEYSIPLPSPSIS